MLERTLEMALALSFYARQHICICNSAYILSPVRLSVRLSVTRVDQSKTVECRITKNFHHTVAPSLKFL